VGAALRVFLAGAVLAAACAPQRAATRVRVVGPRGLGLARVPLAVETVAGERKRIVVTDSDGVAVLGDVPRDGSLRVRVLSGRHALRSSALVEGPEVELGSGAGMPVRLEPVDAETGAPLDGIAWRSCFVSTHEDLTSDAGDGPHTLFVEPGDRCTLFFRVTRAPAGYVAWDRPRCSFRASRYATSFVARYPLRREARVVVRLSGGGDGPRVAYGFRTALGVGLPGIAALGDDGAVRIRGVPFFREELLTVMLTAWTPPMWEEGASFRVGSDRDLGTETIGRTPYMMWEVPGAVLATGSLPVDPRDELVLRARLPRDRAGAVRWPVYRAGGGGDSRRGGGPRPPMPYEAGDGPELCVRVVRRNGTAAAGAKTVIEYVEPTTGRAGHVVRAYVRADSGGVARFPKVPGPWARFLLAEPGLVRTWSERVDVGDAPPMVLREGTGGALVVRVVDAAGRLLPHARIRAETQDLHHVRGPIHCWADEGAGVQRVDPFADEKGSRRYPHVTPGRVNVEAWWLDRRGEAVATVREGETTEAVVTLRPAPR